MSLTAGYLRAISVLTTAAFRIARGARISFSMVISSGAFSRSQTPAWECIASVCMPNVDVRNDKITQVFIDFEGSGAYAQQQEGSAPRAMTPSAPEQNAGVEEPSFEPGETTLHMRVVAKVKFK